MNPKSFLRWLVVLAVIGASLPAAAFARKWVDSSGKHSIEAEFVRVEAGTVYLKRDDGGEIGVPLDKLSQEDQQFVAKAAGAMPPENTSAPAASSESGTEISNSIGMKLVLVPAGEFRMGSPNSEEGRSGYEGPQHKVRITKPFYMGKYEVTQGEFQEVMGRNPSRFSTRGENKWQVSGMDTNRFPVENVSWNDAVEFCRKLSEKESRNYRLPTEAEWEYACRAGTKTPFSFGSVLNGREANCNGESPYGTAEKGPNLQRTTTVGSYPPNAFGLHDMHGNVWEWCADWYHHYYYQIAPEKDPPGPETGSSRVMRGAGWGNAASDCRSALRGSDAPTFRRDVGFRVACDAPEISATR